MKHKTQNTAHAQGKSLRNILYVWDGIHRNQKMAAAKLGEAPPVESKKGLTPIKGKGPPGRPRSPGHYPEHPPDRLESLRCLSNETSPRQIRLNLNAEYQINNINQIQFIND